MADIYQSSDYGRGKAFPAITAQFLAGNFQQTGLRMLRAQERVLHGMANAARLEMKYGQDLLSSRLSLLDWHNHSQPPAEHAAADFELTMTMLREVTEELRSGFTEAAKLLTEDAAPAVQEAVEKVNEALAESADQVKETAQAASAAVKKAAAKAKDADPEP